MTKKEIEKQIAEKKRILKVIKKRFRNKPEIYYKGKKQQECHFVDKDDNPISVPHTSGIYVFYCCKTKKPIYVGETTDMYRRLRHHETIKGKSSFRTKWIPQWISSRDKKKSLKWIREELFIKWIHVELGCKELEKALKEEWNIIKPSKENANNPCD